MGALIQELSTLDTTVPMELLGLLTIVLLIAERLQIDLLLDQVTAMTSTTILSTGVILTVKLKLVMCALTRVLLLILALSLAEMGMISILISAMMEILSTRTGVLITALLRPGFSVWVEIQVDRMFARKYAMTTLTGISSNAREEQESIMMGAILNVR